MEVISEKSLHKQFSYDAMESDFGVKGLENVWSTSFSQSVERQLNSTYLLEMVGCHVPPNVGFLREKPDELYKPVCAPTTNIPPLSCQPSDQKASEGASRMLTNHDVKGFSVDEDFVLSSPSPILTNQTPQLRTSQMYFGNNSRISRSTINNPSLQDSFDFCSYGGSELPRLYGELASQEGHIFQPYAKSPVESACFVLDSGESSASNELLYSSEMKLSDALFDQSKAMEYQIYALEPTIEDPCANMLMIESFTNDGFSFDRNTEPALEDEESETASQVHQGLKGAFSQRFPGYSECPQGNNSRALPLAEADEYLKHPRIDFEGNLVQSHTVASSEGKLQTEDTLVTCGGTQFCLPSPVSGLSSYGRNKRKSCMVNIGLNRDHPKHTCALGNELLDRYKYRKGQLSDMEASSVVQSCCTFASEASAALQSATNKDRVDDCHSKMRDLGSTVKKLCRQSLGRKMKEPGMEFGLVHLLTAAAEAVARKDTCLSSMILARLKDMVLCSNSTMQRVAAYFVQALEHLSNAAMVKDSDLHESKNAHSQGDQLAAFQILHEIFPYVKFGHFTANQAILEVVQGSSKVHVVDFEILEGIQWPAFMQALVSRNGAPAALHITAVCRPKAERESAMAYKTCKRLKEFASSICLAFSYSLLELDGDGDGFEAGPIEILQGETLVVNCMVHLPHMPRHNMARIASFLQAMQAFSPAIITLVEEELVCGASAAAGSYLSEALYHFYALCDSLEACLPLQAEARMLVERVFLESSIRSSISMCNQNLSASAVEVSDKYKCSTVLHALGLKPVPLSVHNQSQARLLLGLHKDGFELEERGHHLVLGWHEKPLYAASVWK